MAAALMFRYALVNRPADIGTIPRGVLYAVEARPAAGEPHHDMARHGILSTQRALTLDELRSFELAPLVDRALLAAFAERICAQGLAEYAAEYVAAHEDDPELFFEAVADGAQRLDPGVRYSICDAQELAAHALECLRRLAQVQP